MAAAIEQKGEDDMINKNYLHTYFTEWLETLPSSMPIGECLQTQYEVMQNFIYGTISVNQYVEPLYRYLVRRMTEDANLTEPVIMPDCCYTVVGRFDDYGYLSVPADKFEDYRNLKDHEKSVGGFVAVAPGDENEFVKAGKFMEWIANHHHCAKNVEIQAIVVDVEKGIPHAVLKEQIRFLSI
jgi:hypothetical protein